MNTVMLDGMKTVTPETFAQRTQEPAPEKPSLGGGGSSFRPASLPQAPQFNVQAPTTPGEWQVHTPDYGALEGAFQDIMGSYGAFRDVVQSQHDTRSTALEQQLANVMEDIDHTRSQGRREQTKARQQIMEDSFDAQRALEAQMSARGLSGSGIEQLGSIQQRIAQGQSISDITNQYYEFEREMQQQVVRTHQEYNIAIQDLNNSLQSALAQIMSQEAATKMDYTQMVDKLQHQVISDANAALEAQRNYDMSLAQFEMQRAQFEQQMYQFEVSTQLQMQQMAQQAAQADRAYSLQQRQYEDSLGSDTPEYSDFLSVWTTEGIPTSAKRALLKQQGFTDSQIAQYERGYGAGQTADAQQLLNQQLDTGQYKGKEQTNLRNEIAQMYNVSPSSLELPTDKKKTTNKTTPAWTPPVTGPVGVQQSILSMYAIPRIK